MALADLFKKAKKKTKDYFAPAPQVRVRDVVRELPTGLSQTWNSIKQGKVGENISNELAKTDYFKPTDKVRFRDFARELPVGVEETAKNVARDTARFGLSLAEIPEISRTGKASGKFYNTPLGRINSFQSEAQNRVNRGDSLLKSIGNPALETVLAGSDLGALSTSLKNFKGAKALPRELRDLADDLTKPLGKKMKMRIPARTERVSPKIYDNSPGTGTFKVVNGKLKKTDGFDMTRNEVPTRIPEMELDVPFEFNSKTIKSFQRPGLTTKATGSASDAFKAEVGPLLLPSGKKTASTPSEAKRLFKQGKLDGMNFDQRPSAKVAITGPDGKVSIGNKRNISSTANKVQRGGLEKELGSEFKDISSTSKGFRDVVRNVEAFFGDKAPQVKKNLIEPFDRAKKTMYENLEKHADGVQRFVKMGFKKGSEMSADLQRFGEGQLSKSDIVKKYGKDKLGKFIHADRYFRREYDRLLDEINEVRARIYPNQPDKLIPKRKDYYRHFREMKEGFAGLKNIFETPAGIQNSLAGASQFAKPKSKWLSMAQRRLGGETDVDAVGGFLNYVESAEYAKNVDPFIEKVRNLQRFVTEAGEKTGKDYNNMVEFLQDYADDLSGKTNPLDRGIQKYIPGGRKAFGVINWLNNRVKANTILGNASSSVAQIFNVPQGIASAGEKNFAKGLKRLANGIVKENEVMSQSPFIKERYFNTMDQFNEGMLKYPKKLAVWMISSLDELGTKAIWNAHYEKALAEGISNPIQYADDIARKMVAGRGIGEVPIAQKSRAFQLVAPFQLEVTNVWHVLKGFKDEGARAKIMKMFLYTYMFNRVAEKVRGSDVAFDPINALMEGTQSFNEEEDKKTGAMKLGGRLGGEVLSNVPFGQTAAAMYPEYGFKVGEREFPAREELFGEGDPTRYGSGLLVAKGIQDPLYKLAPPFGGQQIKRTKEGLESQAKGYTETKSGKVMFPTEKSPLKNVKSAVFGKYSTPEAREYFDNERQPLGTVQSEKFKASGRPYYDKVMADRDAEKEKKKLKAGGSVALAEVGEGMKQLSNGKIYVPDLDKTYSSPEDANLAVEKEKFKESDKNFQTVGDRVLRKREDGSVYTQSKNAYDTQVLNKKMNIAKDKKNMSDWMKYAEEQYANYEKQLQDPTIDELERLNLQDKMDTLLSNVEKYRGYGGFTKGKSSKAKNALPRLSQLEEWEESKPQRKIKITGIPKSSAPKVGGFKVRPTQRKEKTPIKFRIKTSKI